MMFLYGITLVPLVEELRDAAHTLLLLFYAEGAAFDGLTRRIAAQLRLLVDQRPDQVYFPEPDKLLFVFNNLEKKEAEKREFDLAGLNLNNIVGNRYLGAYFRPREKLEAWVRPRVEAWSHRVHALDCRPTTA